MNRIQKNKLLGAKFTAVNPRDREKHFLVTRVTEEEDEPMMVVLEAVYSKQEYTFIWRELKDDTLWKLGWQ